MEKEDEEATAARRKVCEENRQLMEQHSREEEEWALELETSRPKVKPSQGSCNLSCPNFQVKLSVILCRTNFISCY